MKSHTEHQTGRATCADSTTDVFFFSSELDKDFLQATYGHHLPFGLKMFSNFLDLLDEDMEILADAMKSGDVEKTREVTHKNKNNFRWVGASHISNLMQSLENAAMHDANNMQIYYDQIIGQLPQVKNLITEEYRRMKEFSKGSARQ